MVYEILQSPLSAEKMTAGQNSFGAVRLYDNRVYYMESRVREKGRATIVSCDMDGTNTSDELPLPYDAKTRINVYGGVCFEICPHGIIFADKDSKTLCITKEGVVDVLAITPANYADAMYCSISNSLIYVVEALDHDANQHIEVYDFKTKTTNIVASGEDFYHAPQIHGTKYAWLQWNKKDMPWDNSTVVESVNENANIVATGGGHFQPNYDNHGVLHYVSDKGGYFNIYKQKSSEDNECISADSDKDTNDACVLSAATDFALPLWVYGMRTYDFIKNGIIACGVENGSWQLGTIYQSKFTAYDTEAVCIDSLVATDDAFAFIATYKDKMPEVICVYRGDEKCIATAGDCPLPKNYISIGHSISYMGKAGLVQGYYYAPTNPNHSSKILPPLIVKSHGGPTGQATDGFNQKIQFWTSRGFAVLDVNYSGSTGFGNVYRNRLKGRWGELDVADLESGALYLADKGLVNKDRLIISGSSAGGFSVLCALTFGEVFKAGCSIYGIGDLIGLAEETHKFEAHYFDTLIAPYADNKDLFKVRSPINHTDKLNAPVLFLQGLSDAVVPPNQSQRMYDALRQKGIDTAQIQFVGEGHGFRNPQVVVTALLAELSFYIQVFGFKHNENFRVEMNNSNVLNLTEI